MKMVPGVFRRVVEAPRAAPCPTCGDQQEKSWETSRSAIDCCPDGYSLLNVIIGVYYCKYCGKFFRNQPPFMKPGATYTNRVINVAIASVVEDSMPVSKVPQRLQRDFGIRPSEGIVRSWINGAGPDISLDDQIVNLDAVNSFTGVLCFDEAYSSSLGILLATDPGNSDALVGYLVGNESFDSTIVKNVLQRLKDNGIEPDQLVTDGSALYPKVVKDVWPNVAHQLCLFHLNQKLADLGKKAIQSLKKSLPRRQEK